MGAFIDLTGKKIGKWTVIKQQGKKNNQLYWLCKCDCGTERLVNGNSLRNNKSTNCGCVRKQKLRDLGYDLTNQKFNNLLVLEKLDNGKWKCQCDCGNITYVHSSDLINGNIKRCKQCGYKEGAAKRTINLIGQHFGKLTVIAQAPSDSNGTRWVCQCECGNIKTINGSSLKQGLTKSCGCLKSLGEKTIITLLQKNNISFEYQKIFPNCHFSQTDKLARFDFYVNNKYIIEYDGEQHFFYRKNSWYTEQSFKQLQQRDLEKNQFCFNNNIPIIRIPYTHLNQLCIEDLLLSTSSFIVKPV